MITRILFDTFLNSLTPAEKEQVYELAARDMDAAMAKLANRYEEIFGDYPGGFIVGMLMQHLRDRVFHKTHWQAQQAA